MGASSSNPHQLKDHNEALVIRKRYNERLEHDLGMTLIHTEDAIGIPIGLFRKTETPDTYLAVSHGCSSKVGTEFTLRYVAPSKEIAIEYLSQIGMIFGMFLSMQTDSKFRPNETAEILSPLKWIAPCSGTLGAAILLDTTLKGLNSNGDDSFNEEGPLHDEECYWPQHFLLVFPLRPAEYLFTNGVNASICLPVIQSINPHFITDFSREDYLLHPLIGPQLHLLQLSSPSKVLIDGLTLDLRIRKNGQCVDLVMGPRWMAPLLEALNQAFDKPTVPLGTQVIGQDDGLTSYVTFVCHDPSTENVITPDTAYFLIDPVRYAHGKTQEDGTELSEELKRKYSLLTPGELWRDHGLIRSLHVKFFFPPVLLSEMLDRVRAAVLPQMDAGTWDPDSHPLVLEWGDDFHGVNGKSGFVADSPPANNTAVTAPARFRFVSAGMSYSNDQLYIDDEGTFQRIATAEGEDDDDYEDVEEEEG
jgi:hypothetical protein